MHLDLDIYDPKMVILSITDPYTEEVFTCFTIQPNGILLVLRPDL